MFFGKKKKMAQPLSLEPQTEQLATATNSEEVPDLLYDASAVIGGLGWYKKQYAMAMKGVQYLAIALIISGGLNGYLILEPVLPKYFASSPDGQIIELKPLDQPVLSQSGLLNWVGETVTQTLALDFLHWRKKLTDARANFHPEAFKSFVGSMKDTGILKMIEDKRLNLSAVVAQAPVITQSGMLNGRMTWVIECPIILSYESSKGVELTQKLLATVRVRRESTATTPRGVAIQQIVLSRHAE